jgi:hypothetical protein
LGAGGCGSKRGQEEMTNTICDGCRWYEEEPDTNSGWCKRPGDEYPDFPRIMYHCKYYYSKEDAKNDAKYGDRDRY